MKIRRVYISPDPELTEEDDTELVSRQTFIEHGEAVVVSDDPSGVTRTACDAFCVVVTRQDFERLRTLFEDQGPRLSKLLFDGQFEEHDRLIEPCPYYDEMAVYATCKLTARGWRERLSCDHGGRRRGARWDSCPSYLLAEKKKATVPTSRRRRPAGKGPKVRVRKGGK